MFADRTKPAWGIIPDGLPQFPEHFTDPSALDDIVTIVPLKQ
jgi:hypothetical protein